ncbi:hypothetical protein HanRHA438_Chr00c75g0862731 [Helianthus annuus]|nr:hypothetical protein HanRHA438_Chr00c75g0862731 [Helianthus annuus]
MKITIKVNYQENIHFPIANFDFLSENPKLKQWRIASGSIPPPSSKFSKIKIDLTTSKLN